MDQDLTDIGCREMPFGKHKGERIGDIPLSYLDWLMWQDWFRGKFGGLYRDLKVYLVDPAIAKLLEEELR